MLYNPYSPSGNSQLGVELFRLQSKHATLWKLAIVVYEMALPTQIALAVIFWAVIYPQLSKWSQNEEESVFLILEHSVPVALQILDLLSGAIIFNVSHSLILGIFLIAYYLTNFAVAKYAGEATYKDLGLDWIDYQESLIIVVIHLVFTMFVYYILYLVS